MRNKFRVLLKVKVELKSHFNPIITGLVNVCDWRID